MDTDSYPLVSISLANTYVMKVILLKFCFVQLHYYYTYSNLTAHFPHATYTHV